MLTPVELQNKTFKSGGLGYDKKDVEQFFREVTDEFTRLYSENIDLKDRVDALNEALQRYKTMESTLQKALVLAEKTAEDTTQAAVQNARNIEKEAQLKSQIIMADARNELEHVRTQTMGLLQQFEKYKLQFKSLAAAQIELLESDSYSINKDRLEAFIDTSRSSLPHTEELELPHPKPAIRGILFPECTCPGSRSPSKAYLSDYKKLTFTVLPDFSRKKPENIQILYSEAISRFSLKEAVNHS